MSQKTYRFMLTKFILAPYMFSATLTNITTDVVLSSYGTYHTKKLILAAGTSDLILPVTTHR